MGGVRYGIDHGGNLWREDAQGGLRMAVREGTLDHGALQPPKAAARPAAAPRTLKSPVVLAALGAGGAGLALAAGGGGGDGGGKDPEPTNELELTPGSIGPINAREDEELNVGMPVATGMEHTNASYTVEPESCLPEGIELYDATPRERGGRSAAAPYLRGTPREARTYQCTYQGSSGEKRRSIPFTIHVAQSNAAMRWKASGKNARLVEEWRQGNRVPRLAIAMERQDGREPLPKVEGRGDMAGEAITYTLDCTPALPETFTQPRRNTGDNDLTWVRHERPSESLCSWEAYAGDRPAQGEDPREHIRMQLVVAVESNEERQEGGIYLSETRIPPLSFAVGSTEEIEIEMPHMILHRENNPKRLGEKDVTYEVRGLPADLAIEFLDNDRPALKGRVTTATGPKEYTYTARPVDPEGELKGKMMPKMRFELRTPDVLVPRFALGEEQRRITKAVGPFDKGKYVTTPVKITRMVGIGDRPSQWEPGDGYFHLNPGDDLGSWTRQEDCSAVGGNRTGEITRMGPRTKPGVLCYRGSDAQPPQGYPSVYTWGISQKETDAADVAVCMTIHTDRKHGTRPETRPGPPATEGGPPTTTTVQIPTVTDEITVIFNEQTRTATTREYICAPTPLDDDGAAQSAQTAQAPEAGANAVNTALVPEQIRAALEPVHGIIESRAAEPQGDGWSLTTQTSGSGLEGRADDFEFDGHTSQQAVAADWSAPEQQWGGGVVGAYTRGSVQFQPPKEHQGKEGIYTDGRHRLETLSITPYLRTRTELWDRDTTAWAAWTEARGKLSLTGVKACPGKPMADPQAVHKSTTRTHAAAAGMRHALSDWGLSIGAGFEASRTEVREKGCIRPVEVETRDAWTGLHYVREGDDDRWLAPEASVGIRHHGGDGATGRSFTSMLGTRFKTELAGGGLTGRIGVDLERGVGDLERSSTAWRLALRYRPKHQRGPELDAEDGAARAGWALGSGNRRWVPYIQIGERQPTVYGLERRILGTKFSGRIEMTQGEDPTVRGEVRMPIE